MIDFLSALTDEAPLSGELLLAARKSLVSGSSWCGDFRRAGIQALGSIATRRRFLRAQTASRLAIQPARLLGRWNGRRAVHSLGTQGSYGSRPLWTDGGAGALLGSSSAT
jgi:hypothetical protein